MERDASFWAFFHDAWGEDAKEREKGDVSYDKKAWMYVQGRLEAYFRQCSESTTTQKPS